MSQWLRITSLAVFSAIGVTADGGPVVQVTPLGTLAGGDAFLLSVDPADEAGNYNLVTPIITGSFVNNDSSGFTPIPGSTDTGFNALFPVPTFIDPDGFGFTPLGVFDTPVLLEGNFATLDGMNTISSLGVIDFATVILEPGTSAEYTFEFLATGVFVDVVTGAFGAGVAPPVEGDYNDDGFVNIKDYEEWVAAFGDTVAPGSGADGNEDGVVNAPDYTVWRDNFGPGDEDELAPPQNVAGAPEPSAAGLAIVACCATAWSRRRRR